MRHPNDSKKVTWNAFHEVTRNQLAQQIISYAKTNSLIYMGGKCTYKADTYEDEFCKMTVMIVVADLYFKEQFADEKNVEVQHKTLRKDFSYFNYKKDIKTLETLRRIVNNPLEENIEKPLLDKR